MKIPPPRASRRARIEIIPLIDIMFFLLATFVMVSLSMVKNQGLPVKLPVASTSAPQDRKDYTSITINEKGEFFFNKEPIAQADLGPRLQALKASRDDPRIFINGDGKTTFDNVVTVLDETRKAGISKVAIETRKPDGSGPSAPQPVPAPAVPASAPDAPASATPVQAPASGT